jgi:hypothetical protein
MTAETSKSKNPNFLNVMNRFGDITEREMSLEVYLKTPKRARTVSGDSLVILRRKKYTFNRENPVSELLNFYSRNILPKYYLCLKINRIISIQACLISLVLRTRETINNNLS